MHTQNFIGTSGAADRIGYKPGAAYWLLQNPREERKQYWVLVTSFELLELAIPETLPLYFFIQVAFLSVATENVLMYNHFSMPLNPLSLSSEVILPFVYSDKFILSLKLSPSVASSVKPSITPFPNRRANNPVFCKNLLCTNHAIV